MVAPEIQVRRLNAKEKITFESFIFSIGDATAKLQGRDHEIRELALRPDELVGSGDQKRKTTLNPATTSGRLKETSFIVIMLNPEFLSVCQKEESFPTPVKCIVVNRTTHTDLDVMQEKRVNDHWNVDGDRTLSDL